MIRFGCPRCGAVLKVPEEKAGAKAPCPRCGQRLQVPAPVDKTVLGRPLPAGPRPTPIAAPQALPVAVTVACPHCRSSFEAGPDQAGHPITCPHCGGESQMPGAPAPPRPVAVPVTVPVVAVPVSAAPPPIPPTAPPGDSLAFPEGGSVVSRRSILRRRRWSRWAVAALLLLLLGGAVGVAIRLVMTGGYLGAAGQVPEDRPTPRTDEEELVRRFIVNNSPDPKRVRFVRWGPHMSRRECLELAKEAGVDELVNPREKEALKERLAAFHGFYRVRYRGSDAPVFGAGFGPAFGPGLRPEGTPLKDVDHDWLFAVHAKLVIPIQPFQTIEDGDNWKKTARKNFSKFLPGIDPEK